MEMSNTKVICAVYGPRQTNKSEFNEKCKLQCEFKYATFASKRERKTYQQDKDEKEKSNLMVQALEDSILLHKFPKSVIDINVLVIECDGGALGAAITCASMALADAGIQIYDCVAACSAVLIDSNIILDPTDSEESKSTASILVAHMPSLNEVTQLFECGQVEFSKAQEAVDLCIDGCAKLYSMMRQTIMPKQKKSLKTP